MTAYIETTKIPYRYIKDNKRPYLIAKNFHRVTVGNATFITRKNLKLVKSDLKDYDLVCTRKETTRSAIPSQVFQ